MTLTPDAPPRSLQVIEGDLFASHAQTWVNTVNTVGVMGKGVALEFKRRFPDMYEDYVRRCRAGEVRLGQPYLFRRVVEPWVLNFPTKDHWRSLSRLADIVAGVHYLREQYQAWGITSLAVPALGCGNGGLEWRVVGPTLYRLLADFTIPVELYAPRGTPEAELSPAFLGAVAGVPIPEQRMDPAWVALVAIIQRVTAQPYHWPVGRVTFRKIAYFATEAGLPTGLAFERGSYGPFAPGLKTVESRLLHHGLLHAEPAGRMIRLAPGSTFADAAHAYADQLDAWAPLLDRVADLFLRLRTQDAEVAASVHFAAHRLVGATAQASEQDVLAAVQAWKQRRQPPLADEDVAVAVRNLNVMDWIQVRASRDLPLPDEAAAVA